MGRLVIICGMLLLLFSCQEEKKDNTSITEKLPPDLLSFDKARKLLEKYTGRRDTSMYLLCYMMDFDVDQVNENVVVSEMLSDPQPLVSVYFKKKDTLVFIPVPTVSGTVPEVRELSLEDGKCMQLGVWYMSREEGGSYSYNFSAYAFHDFQPYCLFSFQLYRIDTEGNINQPLMLEIDLNKEGETEVRLFEAKVQEGRSDAYYNKGPLLVKKSEEPSIVYIYTSGAIKGNHLIPVKGIIGFQCAKIAPGENY